MAQPSLNLPAPTKLPAAVPPAVTDDFLSQLAGNEIDRLLADAGVEPTDSPTPPGGAAPLKASSTPPAGVASAATPQPVAAAAPAVAVVSAAADGPIAKELDQVFDRQLSEATTAVPAAAAAPSPQELAADASAVSSLLDRIDSEEGPASPIADSSGSAGDPKQIKASTEAPPPTVATGNGAADVDTPASGASAGEAAVLEAPIEIDLKSASGKPLWGWRLFSALAIPLDPFPDRVRDAVGKVAIVTTINAIAVLVYVLFFKK